MDWYRLFKIWGLSINKTSQPGYAVSSEWSLVNQLPYHLSPLRAELSLILNVFSFLQLVLLTPRLKLTDRAHCIKFQRCLFFCSRMSSRKFNSIAFLWKRRWTTWLFDGPGKKYLFHLKFPFYPWNLGLMVWEMLAFLSFSLVELQRIIRCSLD